MSDARTLLALTAAGAAILTPALALCADAATAPVPKLLQAELVTAPEMNAGTVAVVFRADHRLARGSNGGTLKGRAGLTGRGNASLGSVKGPKGHACYVAYLDGKSLRVGHPYPALITIGTKDHHRTLRLKKPRRVADLGADLNC